MAIEMTTNERRIYLEDIRCGKLRPSMKTNLLIQNVELGKPKKTTFQSPPPERVFGIIRPADPEGARDVSMIWKEHAANPDARPGPDFRTTNKLAAMRGLTTAKQQHAFRAKHTQPLTTHNATSVPSPLPSERNSDHVYGKPSTYKSMEDIRVVGRDDPVMKHLMQGAYGWDWIRMNLARAEDFDSTAHYIAPGQTKATVGHAASHAAAHAVPAGTLPPGLLTGNESGTFKLSKFTKNATYRVDDRRPKAIAKGNTVQTVSEISACNPSTSGSVTVTLPGPAVAAC